MTHCFVHLVMQGYPDLPSGEQTVSPVLSSLIEPSVLFCAEHVHRAHLASGMTN